MNKSINAMLNKTENQLSLTYKKNGTKGQSRPKFFFVNKNVKFFSEYLKYLNLFLFYACINCVYVCTLYKCKQKTQSKALILFFVNPRK